MPVIFALIGLEVSVSVIGRLSASPAAMGDAALQRVANRRILVDEGAETGERPGLFARVEMGVDILDRAAVSGQFDPPFADMQHAHRGAGQETGEQRLRRLLLPAE